MGRNHLIHCNIVLIKQIEYLKSHEKTIAIVSGGQGKGEDISEALAMKQGLIKQNRRRPHYNGGQIYEYR